jgi:AraC-like DNA-binding protein
MRLLLAHPYRDVRAPQVAGRLHMSDATLRRHLQSQDTSFQALLDAVRWRHCRRTLARRWLPGKSLAYELGYSQPNSFYRAFRKWTGMTYSASSPPT